MFEKNLNLKKFLNKKLMLKNSEKNIFVCQTEIRRAKFQNHPIFSLQYRYRCTYQAGEIIDLLPGYFFL